MKVWKFDPEIGWYIVEEIETKFTLTKFKSTKIKDLEKFVK